MSVYHGTLIASLDEDNLFPALYLVISMFSLVGLSAEYVIFNRVEETLSFKLAQHDSQSWNMKSEFTLLIGAMILVAAMIVLQLRKEYDAYSYDEPEGQLIVRIKRWILASGQVNPSNQEEPSYTATMTRLVCAVIVGMLLISSAMLGSQVVPFRLVFLCGVIHKQYYFATLIHLVPQEFEGLCLTLSTKLQS